MTREEFVYRVTRFVQSEYGENEPAPRYTGNQAFDFAVNKRRKNLWYGARYAVNELIFRVKTYPQHCWDSDTSPDSIIAHFIEEMKELQDQSFRPSTKIRFEGAEDCAMRIQIWCTSY